MRIRPSQILGIFFLLPLLVCAQNSQEEKEFNKLVYDLCLEKPLKQLEIDEVMHPYRSDLQKMNLLLNEAMGKGYEEGEGYARKVIGIQFQNLGLNDIARIYFDSAKELISDQVDEVGVKELELYRLQTDRRVGSATRLSEYSQLRRFFEQEDEEDLWANALLSESRANLDLDRSRDALVLLEHIRNEIPDPRKELSEQIAVLELDILLNQQRYRDASFKAYDMLNVENQISLRSRVQATRVLVECEKNIGTASLALDFQKHLDSLELLLAKENLSLLSDRTEQYLATVEQQDENLADLKDKRNRTLVIGAILILGLLGMILLNVYRQYLSDNEKKVLSLEQRMLRSQMNPHFIFNSLNSIKQFIVVNDKEKAVRYLNKFAKLMRKILDGSGKRETSLAEELETVELYLNIENMRFSNKIEINLQVDPSLNTELIKVPSLLLQPFLENAIWHGLSEKEGDKKIWIHVQRENDLRLRISVTDNGIGREMAAVRKRNRSLKRTSVGLKNTRERLGHFAENYQKDFDLEFHDLENSNGSAAGTQVVLKIPLV